jgi:hypothetical protein
MQEFSDEDKQNTNGGGVQRNIWDFQQRLKYHTTADWEDRTPEEVNGEAPPKMEEWLLRVRGY